MAPNGCRTGQLGAAFWLLVLFTDYFVLTLPPRWTSGHLPLKKREGRPTTGFARCHPGAAVSELLFKDSLNPCFELWKGRL